MSGIAGPTDPAALKLGIPVIRKDTRFSASALTSAATWRGKVTTTLLVARIWRLRFSRLSDGQVELTDQEIRKRQKS